jgi:hypothetical protein
LPRRPYLIRSTEELDSVIERGTEAAKREQAREERKRVLEVKKQAREERRKLRDEAYIQKAREVSNRHEDRRQRKICTARVSLQNAKDQALMWNSRVKRFKAELKELGVAE